MELTGSPCSYVSENRGNPVNRSDTVKDSEIHYLKRRCGLQYSESKYIFAMQTRFGLVTRNLTDDDPPRLWGNLQPITPKNQPVLCYWTVRGDWRWHASKAQRRNLGDPTGQSGIDDKRMWIIHKLIRNWSGVGYAHSSYETANHRRTKERNFGQCSVNKKEV